MAARPRGRLVATPVGPARVSRYRAAGPEPLGRLVLGHGAGRGADTADLLLLARELPRYGVEVLLVDQPWVVAGRPVAAAPATLDEAWEAVVSAVPRDGVASVWGGRSAGARVAARTATRSVVPPGALLLLAFPLHPPGRPGSSRSGELAGALAAGLPVVAVQGQRDPFGGPAELRAAAAGLRVVALAGCGHDLLPSRRGPLTRGEVDDLIVTGALAAVRSARSRSALG